MKLKSPEELLKDLARYGGAIVRAKDCNPLQIEAAEEESRLADGFVRRTAETINAEKELLEPIADQTAEAMLRGLDLLFKNKKEGHCVP